MCHGGSFLAPVVLLFACVVPLVGCGPRSEATVNGKITLDGSPLDDATIAFVPMTEGQRNAAWTTIKNGEYAIPASKQLVIGKYRVEIRAVRADAAKPKQDDPTLPEFSEEIVPERYNSKSELVVEMRAGKNTADFDLKSK